MQDDATTTDASAVSDTKNPRLIRWKGQIDLAKAERKQQIPDWSRNVDYRRGKIYENDSDENRVGITIDWSATKAKQAQLFSQVPEVRLTAEEDNYAAGVPIFQRKLNRTAYRAGVGVAMDECLPDCINASGFGVMIVSAETRTQDKQVPRQDPVGAKFAPAAPVDPSVAPQPPQMETIPQPVNIRYLFERISPADFLKPVQFEGSDFDRAPWRGRTGRTTWADAQQRFKLKDTDQEKFLGADSRTVQDRISSADGETKQSEPVVEYDEIYYWRYLYHPEEMSFERIHHLVMINGTAVIDEKWKGQKELPDGTIIGSCKPPIRVLTLTYLSDESIPPSDSAIGRSQVDELARLRTLSMLQRETSLPMRWMNVNLLDPLVQAGLLRGTWQKIVPINGSGDKAMGEMARASFPNDDYRAYDAAKSELAEGWQVSGAQIGTNAGPALRSASEATIVQQNFQTRVGYERARVVNFFIGGMEVLAGLMCVLNDFTDTERQALAAWEIERTSLYYKYSVRADASVLLDASQRLERLEKYLNLTAKSGYVNVKPIIEEISLLSGVDPSKVLIDPQPKAPEPANVSIRSAEDLQDVLMLAMLVKNGQAPGPEEINNAKQLLLAAQGPMQPPPPPQPSAGPAGAPPGGAPDPHPDWDEASRINKRSHDGQ